MKQGRKISGGRYKKPKKKKLVGRPGQARVVKLGDTRRKLLKGRGGITKLVSFSSDVVNLIGGKRAKKGVIKNVVETPSNTFLARQNILVKGAIIETDLGKARITNRPSQEGNVQAVLLD
jgi:small subunit ribosomal protein S8e